jgi:hypothetical protein
MAALPEIDGRIGNRYSGDGMRSNRARPGLTSLMSHTHEESTPTVIHVCPDRAAREASREQGEWLAAFATNGRCVVETFGDVYRALARVGRDDEHAVHAVLVCVDELTPAELEFFELLHRHRRDVAQGVYGSGRRRLDRYVAVGAREIESEAAFRNWIAGVICDDTRRRPGIDPQEGAIGDRGETHAAGASSTRPGSDTPPTSDRESATEVPLAGENESGRTETPPVVVTEHGDDEIDEPAATAEPSQAAIRVPWLKYGGGPSRAAPQRAEPSANPRRTANAPAHPARAPYEPLLTDEELRALIGDDLVSLGPERGGHDVREPDDDEGSA